MIDSLFRADVAEYQADCPPRTRTRGFLNVSVHPAGTAELT